MMAHLGRLKQDISQAMQTDQLQLATIESTKQTITKLPLADRARFDAYSDQLNARCHRETRVELLGTIREWIKLPDSKCIFWLNGMAGTGKSTIARTIAQECLSQGSLAATFFFKRGEGDRGNASRFFTTIASQLAQYLPDTKDSISDAINEDPAIVTSNLAAQFQCLVLNPLTLSDYKTNGLVIVVDALDECEGDTDIRSIINLFGELHESCPNMRVFLTSRPELHIRLGFEKLSLTDYDNLVLHSIERNIIEHDIQVYLKDELVTIREANVTELPIDWPSQEQIAQLTSIAQPLFIAAATILRFIGDSRFDPDEQLKIILDQPGTNGSIHLGQIYQPILNQQLANLEEMSQLKLIAEFHNIVGAIVVLADNLSSDALAVLLKLPYKTVRRRLDALHSVLSVPSDPRTPIRLLHLSFREYLVEHSNLDNVFHVDQGKMHAQLSVACLRLLNETAVLKNDVCDLNQGKFVRHDMEPKVFQRCVSAEIRYACRYWIQHIHASREINVAEDIHHFLKKHFLHWIEVMTWIGDLMLIPDLITVLIDLYDHVAHRELNYFLREAKEFVNHSKGLMEIYPLQLYTSALLFANPTQMIRESFSGGVPQSIQGFYMTKRAWVNVNINSDSHSSFVRSITFSSDGKYFATAANDGTAKVWCTHNAKLLCTLSGHTTLGVLRAVFVPDEMFLATFDQSGLGRIWNRQTGQLVRIFGEHVLEVISVISSEDNMLVAMDCRTTASVTLRQISVWDLTNYRHLLPLNVSVESSHTEMSFSRDGTLLAARHHDKGKNFKIINVRMFTTIECAGTNSREDHVWMLQFSTDNSVLAALNVTQLHIDFWRAIDGLWIHRLQLERTIPSELKPVRSVDYDFQFLPHTTDVLVWSHYGKIYRHSINNDFLEHVFQDCIGPLAISYDNMQLAASLLADKRLIVTNITTGTTLYSLPSEKWVWAWLPNDQGLLAQDAWLYELWSMPQCTMIRRFNLSRMEVSQLTTANNDKWIVCRVENQIQIWNILDGTKIAAFEILEESIRAYFTFAVSYDGTRLATWTSNAVDRIRIFSITDRHELSDLSMKTTTQGASRNENYARLFASPYEHYLVVIRSDVIIAINTDSCTVERSIPVPSSQHDDFVRSLRFSPIKSWAAIRYINTTQLIELKCGITQQLIIDHDKFGQEPDSDLEATSLRGKHKDRAEKWLAIAYSPDGGSLLCYNSDYSPTCVIRHDIGTGTVLWTYTLTLEEYVPFLRGAISRNAKHALLYSVNRNHIDIMILDATNGVLQHGCRLDTGLTSISAIGDQDQSIRFDVSSSYLETTQGILEFDYSKFRHRFRHSVWLEDQWAVLDHETTIWLPPHLRSKYHIILQNKSLSVTQNNLVLIYDLNTGTTRSFQISK